MFIIIGLIKVNASLYNPDRRESRPTLWGTSDIANNATYEADVDLKYIAYWTQCIRITAKYEISYPVM